jgi:hypothetical protein
VQAALVLARNHAAKPNEEMQNMTLMASELEQNIAEQLSMLVAPGPTPDGVRPAPHGLNAPDVRFEDGSWRGIVVEVQGWLHLPRELASDSPEAFDDALATALMDQNGCVTQASCWSGWPNV